MWTMLLVVTLNGAADPWFSADKIKHFFMSAFVQSVTYSALRATSVGHRSSLYGATVTTVAVGVAKELHDRGEGAHVSVADLTWDAAGAGVATLYLDRSRR
ncbi:MAG: hypothetical protein ACRENI_05015 [Gemmatimonadaceae bacterium]